MKEGFLTRQTQKAASTMIKHLAQAIDSVNPTL
jgi:hypothetical protein